jgi:hypothetical protein
VYASARMGDSGGHLEYCAILAPFSLPAGETLEGLGQINVTGTTGGDEMVLAAGFAHFAVEVGRVKAPISSDGRFRLLVPAEGIPANVGKAYLLLSEQNNFTALKSHQRLESPVYQMQLSGALATFTAPVALTIYPSRSPEQPDELNVAHYDPQTQTWILLPTTWNEPSGAASAVTTHTGLFALLRTVELEKPSDPPTPTDTPTPTVSPTPTDTPTLAVTPTPTATPTPITGQPDDHRLYLPAIQARLPEAVQERMEQPSWLLFLPQIGE